MNHSLTLHIILLTDSMTLFTFNLAKDKHTKKTGTALVSLMICISGQAWNPGGFLLSAAETQIDSSRPRDTFIRSLSQQRF